MRMDQKLHIDSQQAHNKRSHRKFKHAHKQEYPGAEIVYSLANTKLKKAFLTHAFTPY